VPAIMRQPIFYCSATSCTARFKDSRYSSARIEMLSRSNRHHLRLAHPCLPARIGTGTSSLI
jgi:hypothetical protein